MFGYLAAQYGMPNCVIRTFLVISVLYELAIPLLSIGMTAPVIINAEKEDAKAYMSSCPSTKCIKPSFTSFDSIRKSDVDKCEYRIITLSNQLQILLIREDGLDKASAAMDVHVGSFSDPKDIPGVAHFLEHLLFMGTEKYPKENDYMKFLASHGGDSNAFTENEHTNYFFEVGADHFEPALDRFAQFFVAPLFNPDGTDREMKAVDSEHKKNVKDDMWRIHQMERTLADPNHPYSNFGTGCSISLNKPGIRDVIVDFYKKHYSANIMKGVLYGKESLDILAEWAEEKFSKIPNHSFLVPSFPERPWTEMKKIISIKTVKEMQTLFVGWQTGDIRQHNRAKPDVYLSHLIGHEGQGSLLSFLKKKDLVLGLSAGFDELYHGFSFFQISFDLTPKGLENTNKIIKSLFQFIAMLGAQQPQKWIQDECGAINDISFRFKDKSQSSSSYAYKLANQMQEYSPERVLSGPFLIEDWDPELIESILSQFTVDNCRMMLTYSGFKPDSSWSQEKWYGTMYKVESVDKDLLEECGKLTGNENPELRLPCPNEFIPKKLDYIGKIDTKPKQHPDLLADSLWFKQDDQFGLPKSSYYVLFKTPLVFENALNSASAGLFIEYVKVALTEITYDATLAGLSYELSSAAEGLEIRVSGFNEKAPVLLEKIVSYFLDAPSIQTIFDSVKDRFERHLKSLKEEKAIWHASYYAGGLLQEKMLHWKDKLAALDKVDISQVLEFGRDAVKSSSIVVLVNGNESTTSAMSIKQRLNELVSPRNCYPSFCTIKSVKIPIGDSVFRGSELSSSPNSAIDFYLQIGSLGDAKSRQSCELYVQIFSEAFFDQLRTKEQLGYIAIQQIRDKGISTGIRMAIQSERDPIYLESRIESFLDQSNNRLSEMSEDEFSKYKQSLISDLTARKKKLSQESKAFWEEITGCRKDFEKNLVDARSVAKLSKQDIIDFSKKHILKDAPERRKLVVHIWSETKEKELKDAYADRKVIDDINQFVGACEHFDISYNIPQ